MNTSRTGSARRSTLVVAAAATTAILALAGCAPGGTVAGPDTATDVSTELTKEKVELTIADETGFPVTDVLAEEFTKQHPNITFNITRDTFANLTAIPTKSSSVRAANSGSPTLERMLYPPRATAGFPIKLTTGTPIHKASRSVVWPL